MNKIQKTPAALAITCCLALALSACGTYGPGKLAVGQSNSEVEKSLGTPTARYALPRGMQPEGGTRLEFARGPFGGDTFMVDVDTSGKVTRWAQVLTERNFEAIPQGMSTQDLLLTLGTPSHRRGGGWQGGEVWSYRYNATFCQWFQVSIIDGKVKDPAYGPDPRCDVNDDKVSRWRVR
jgi:hypothetical protein